MRPKDSTALPTRSLTDVPSVTSTSPNAQLPVPEGGSWSSVTSAPSTLAPSSRRRAPVALPMPGAAPVTITFLPSSPHISSSLIGYRPEYPSNCLLSSKGPELAAWSATLTQRAPDGPRRTSAMRHSICAASRSLPGRSSRSHVRNFRWLERAGCRDHPHHIGDALLRPTPGLDRGKRMVQGPARRVESHSEGLCRQCPGRLKRREILIMRRR